MPKSKRDKKVSLTKTAKHDKEWKKKMILDLKESAELYENIYMFKVVGMRGNALRELRMDWKDSKIFLGKNKIMEVALGRSEQTEVKQNLHLLTARITGESGVLMTNKDRKEVQKFFDSFVQKDYARAGNVAAETVRIPEGPLPQFSHAIEPHLRSLGLPTCLKRGVVTMLKKYKVCKRGQVLNPEQAKILKLMEIQMAEFRIILDCVWSSPDSFLVLVEEEADEEEPSGEVEQVDLEEEVEETLEDMEDEEEEDEEIEH